MSFLYRLVLGIFGLYAWMTGACFAQSCDAKPVATIQLDLSGGELLVPARVNGTAETMLLDTGAALSALRDDVVETLGLQREQLSLNVISDVEGRSFNQAVAVPSLELGDVKLGDIELGAIHMLIAPRPGPTEKSDGIVGADLLHRYDADLDFPNRKLTLFEPAHCVPESVFGGTPSTSIPLRLGPGGLLYIPVTLDNKSMEALLDTGAANSVMTLNAFHRRFGLSQDSDGVRFAGSVIGANRSQMAAYRYGFQRLSLSDIGLDTPQIALIPDETRRLHRVSETGPPDTGLPDLLIGMSEMAKLHLFISYADSVIHVAKP